MVSVLMHCGRQAKRVVVPKAAQTRHVSLHQLPTLRLCTRTDAHPRSTQDSMYMSGADVVAGPCELSLAQCICTR